MNFSGIMHITFMLLLAVASAQEYTRGVGVYPGNPEEYFGPAMQLDTTSYRNLALRRPAYHSSSYDYNLTAQLVTDGIKESKMPRWIATATSEQGELEKNEREWLLDGNWVSGVNLKGPRGWVEMEIGGDDVPAVDRVDVEAFVQAKFEPENWSLILMGSDDRKTWEKLGETDGMARPGGEIRASIRLPIPSRCRCYRIAVEDRRASGWWICELAFFGGRTRLPIGGPRTFTSAWMAAGKAEEWVCVDLGAICAFDRIALYWVRRPAQSFLQISDDGVDWEPLQEIPATSAAVDNLSVSGEGRYVRVWMTRPASADGYVLSEMEVYGRGGPVPVPKAAPGVRADGRLDLAGGAWRLQRNSLVPADGESLSSPEFPDEDWLVATVPGTVLSSHYNAGALPDPNYGDNQLMISDSFFHDDFWYRNKFAPPPWGQGDRVWLNFDGINWKAEVFLNARKLGVIEGGFTRGRFDVTEILRPGTPNTLAVRIRCNANPGSVKEKTFGHPDKNGGILGADNPTCHATIGWDWIPTIRGRDTGLWNDVYLTVTGPVTLENPLVSAALEGTARADIAVEVTLRNSGPKAVSGTLRGRFGETAFETPVTVGASGEQWVKVDPSTHAGLRIQNPTLWWPAGYGDPHLYPVELTFETGDGRLSHRLFFKVGVRQFSYSEEGGVLKLWVNGRRFIARGGNWGFSESMLRYRGREYDVAVRYHRDMNFTMIRNWVGQVGDEEFYDACDRHGIVVWQDFWLANPWDGPDPGDNEIFLLNVEDTVRKIRNHPCVGLYCGRNEGYPPKILDDRIRQALSVLHPGIHYISSSADDVASGHGPYRAMPVRHYFEQAPAKFHSEMGMPNIPPIESLKSMMPKDALWPPGRMWGLHDFCLEGAQGGSSFLERIDKRYGSAGSVEEWAALAQFVNYEGYRAMFEAQSKNRMGLLIWMSHPAWPSLVWQTYDYYFEPTAAYFGCKKASEPLHIQWNPVNDDVEVVNYSGGDAPGMTARAEIWSVDGVLEWEKRTSLDSPEDTTTACMRIEYPTSLTPMHFLRLKLVRQGKTVSENFYWRGAEEGNYRAIRDIPRVRLKVATRSERHGDRWRLSAELHNPSRHPALMVRVKAVREKSGDRILPALYSDNYVSLMPGERCTVEIELANADTRGENPSAVVEGYNIK